MSPDMQEAEELRRRNRELTILNAVAATLNRADDLTRALEATLSAVVQAFDLRTGWIWLLNEQAGEFYLAASVHLPPALLKPHRMEGWCHCRERYAAGEMDAAANIGIIQCSRLKDLVDGTDGLRAHASVPLDAHGKRVGILNLVSHDWRELSEADLRLLTTIGHMLSIAVERARLFTRSASVGAAEERVRLAREIHDTLAQGLSATALQLETADALLEDPTRDVDRVRAVVRRALTQVRGTLDEARRSVADLRAAPLEGRRLAPALADLADAQAESAGMAAQVSVSNELPPLGPRVEVALYRITQEAVANVVRHAQARTLSVRLEVEGADLKLTVADDGRGFDPSAVSAGHFGLIGLNERVRLLGGRLDIASAPGRGTAVTVRLPVA